MRASSWRRAGPTGPERLPHQLFEHTVRVNLLGVWYGCQAAGRRMLADGEGGSIINVSSVLGLGGQQNYPPACTATKATVINLTRALAVSWDDRGVRTNALAPGWFPSEMTEPWFAARRSCARSSSSSRAAASGSSRSSSGRCSSSSTAPRGRGAAWGTWVRRTGRVVCPPGGGVRYWTVSVPTIPAL